MSKNVSAKPTKEKPITASAPASNVKDRPSFNDMLFRILAPNIAEAIKQNINDICLENTFSLSEHTFTWNRINRRKSKQLDNIIEGKIEFPDGLDDEGKAAHIQKEFLKLCYAGMTDEVYEELDLGAIQVMMHAPFVRQQGLFRYVKQ